MDPKKKAGASKQLEKREREFNVYVSGANAERVENQRRKEKHDISQSRSKSKNTRKPWGVEPRLGSNQQLDENENKKEEQEVQPKRERRRWGDPEPIPINPSNQQSNQGEYFKSPKKDIMEDIPDSSDNTEDVESRELRDSPETIQKKSREDEENDDIKNFISSMSGEDIEKLRQSIAGTFKEDDMKKALQGISSEDLIRSSEKKEAKKKKIANEIDEEIAEDIDENPVDLDYDHQKSTSRAETYYHAGKPISIRKARPISATYNDVANHRPIEPIYAAIPFQSKQSDSKKNYESFTSERNEFRESTPFEKMNIHPKMSNSPTSKISSMKGPRDVSPREVPANFAVRGSRQEKVVSIPQKTELRDSLDEERKSTKGQNSLLKRIEGLDEGKKLLLESILDKIEKGHLDKEILLNLEFLNIKKTPGEQQQEVRRSKEVKEVKKDKKDNKKHLPTKQELTLPSSVESKISKITKNIEKSPQLPQKSKLTLDDEPIRPAPTKIESLKKPTEESKKNLPDIMPKTNLVDSLEQKSFPKKVTSKENNFNSNPNPEPVTFPEILTRKVPDTIKEPTPTKEGKELRIADPGLNMGQDHQIQFRIISTWGNISQAGLTEIQVFNESGEKIELKTGDFHMRNCGLTSIKNVSKIIDGVVYTTEEEHMWLCSMPAPPTTPEISITVRSSKGIGGLRIWNYNKSLIESIKGIKELEIIHNRNIVWSGIVNRGPGNEHELYHTEVLFKKDVKLPKIEAPTQVNAPYEFTPVENQGFNNDVPIWLKDTLTGQPIKASIENKNFPSGQSGRRESERSSTTTLNAGRGANESTKSLLDKVQGQGNDFNKLESANIRRQHMSDMSDINQTNDTSKGSDANKSLTRNRNAPKNELPIKDILDEKSFSKPEEKTPKPTSLSDQKENVHSHSGKKDDNSSINSVEYFNITNFGRLKPVKRESLTQVFNLQQDVLEKIKDVQKRLEFKTTPITEETDILTQFDKGLKEDQPKLKIPQQSVEQASLNIGKRKDKDIGTKKAATIQTKTPVDVLDTMVSKTASAKNIDLDVPSQTKSVEKILYENRSFKIPELPRGRSVRFCIYSTWGDAHYVGLNGIEIFDEKGDLIILEDVPLQIRANPPDINCLPGYGKDPRTVDKLVDGTYLTCDDLHVWLAPFTQGKEHTVEIDFRETKTISLIRIWNYNKSRIHSYRGARDIAIKLDEQPIFLGEISKAPGNLKGAEEACEYILFTENENVLGRIEKNDWLNKIPKHDLVRPDLNATLERPMTGTRLFDENDMKQIQNAFNNQPLLGPDGRPLTMAKMTIDNSIRDQIEKNKKELMRLEQQERIKQEREKANINKALIILNNTNTAPTEIKCKNLVVIISKSWGDPYYVGLTGLEVYDGEGNKIPLDIKNLNAKPKDMNSIPGYSGDQRTLDKLINHNNLSVKDENMWLIPYTQNQNHYIYINFDEVKTISGIRFWNYNKGKDGSYRGTKCINISADGVMLTPPSGVLLRKAPGTDYYDYSQFIPLPFLDGWDEETVKLYKNMKPQPMQGFLIQEYDTPEFPTGFCYKIKLLSTWGDYDYIGLNGLELYDHKGEPLLSKAPKGYKISAEPESVSCLPNHDDDIRTLDKLVNGVYETFDDRNMWLAPYVLERRDEGLFKVDNNEIVILFEKPKIISCIKFWNYSKTQTRGVKEVEIQCDDNILYRGYLRMAPTEKEYSQNTGLSTSILFTKEKDIIKKVDPNLYTEDGKPQRVILYNEKKIINPASESRPQTQVTLERPTTSVKGLISY